MFFFFSLLLKGMYGSGCNMGCIQVLLSSFFVVVGEFFDGKLFKCISDISNLKFMILVVLVSKHLL